MGNQSDRTSWSDCAKYPPIPIIPNSTTTATPEMIFFFMMPSRAQLLRATLVV